MAKENNVMMGIIPNNWDKNPINLAHELELFLNSIKDESTSIDSGGGNGFADLWVTVQGIEYFITIRQSRKALGEKE